jgi:hypothetical protein
MTHPKIVRQGTGTLKFTETGLTIERVPVVLPTLDSLILNCEVIQFIPSADSDSSAD